MPQSNYLKYIEYFRPAPPPCVSKDDGLGTKVQFSRDEPEIKQRLIFLRACRSRQHFDPHHLPDAAAVDHFGLVFGRLIIRKHQPDRPLVTQRH